MLNHTCGRAIAQAVSRRLPTAAARVRSQVKSCGICGGQSGTVTCFLRVLPFPLPILIPPTAPHSSSIIRGWYNRPVSGQRTKWTQSHPNPKKLKKKELNHTCPFTHFYSQTINIFHHTGNVQAAIFLCNINCLITANG
jgi:hypothetical protein